MAARSGFSPIAFGNARIAFGCGRQRVDSKPEDGFKIVSSHSSIAGIAEMSSEEAGYECVEFDHG